MTAKFEAEGAHYDFLARQVRVYFPVRDALVYHKRELVEANERGELPHKRVDGDMSIVGRFQSESVAGDASNVIRDGIVYLSAAHPVLHMRGNVHFYDFGTKRGHDHAHDHKRRYPDGIEDPNKGCYA
jgi:hypothetical protein